MGTKASSDAVVGSAWHPHLDMDERLRDHLPPNLSSVTTEQGFEYRPRNQESPETQILFHPRNMVIRGFKPTKPSVKEWKVPPSQYTDNKWRILGYKHPDITCEIATHNKHPTIIVDIVTVDSSPKGSSIQVQACWSCLVAGEDGCTALGEIIGIDKNTREEKDEDPETWALPSRQTPQTSKVVGNAPKTTPRKRQRGLSQAETTGNEGSGTGRDAEIIPSADPNPEHPKVAAIGGVGSPGSSTQDLSTSLVSSRAGSLEARTLEPIRLLFSALDSAESYLEVQRAELESEKARVQVSPSDSLRRQVAEMQQKFEANQREIRGIEKRQEDRRKRREATASEVSAFMEQLDRVGSPLPHSTSASNIDDLMDYLEELMKGITSEAS